jgi:lipoyl-dependent peroxiredoxin
VGALIAKERGFEPLVMEGPTRSAGGVGQFAGGLRIPDNAVIVSAEIPDSYEAALTYMEDVIEDVGAREAATSDGRFRWRRGEQPEPTDWPKEATRVRQRARATRHSGEKGEDVIDRILYTAEATVEGGREGHARTSDSRLEVMLDVPAEMGGKGGPGTNPEQLFAVGYAACFQSALMRIAAGQHLDLAGSRITARVGIGPEREGGFALAVALDLDAPAIGHADASELMTRAHETCPYSRATRGNIAVTLAVAGAAIERPTAVA